MEDGFAAFFSRYESRIYAFIYYTTGDADNAAELTRETFLRAYLELGESAIGDGAELEIEARLYRLAAAACLGTGRRLWARWGEFARRRAAATRDNSAPRATLDRLPPRHRLALLLREYAGLSCADIGAALDISGEAVRALLFRAREEFRSARADYGAGSCPPRQPQSALTRQGGWFDEETSAR